MSFITKEQFLDQPKEIQKVFIDWWQPKEGDRVIGDEWAYPDFIERELSFKTPRYEMYGGLGIGSGHGKNELIPLFRLNQLWEFIESNNYQIGINNFIEKDQWNIKVFKSMIQFKPDIEVQDEDKLKALWSISLIIAGEKTSKDKYRSEATEKYQGDSL